MILRFLKRQPSAETPEAAANAAFGRLLQEHLPRLRRYAVALVGNVAMADDLLQDTVERALSRQASLESPNLVYPWLRSILHNLHIDEIRRRRNRGIAVDIDDLADTLALSAPAADRSSTQDFVRAMAALSHEHRQILLLIGLEGLSYKEIAAALDVPIGTVMSRVARAREQLRLKLDPPEPVTRSGADIIRLPLARP